MFSIQMSASIGCWRQPAVRRILTCVVARERDDGLLVEAIHEVAQVSRSELDVHFRVEQLRGSGHRLLPSARDAPRGLRNQLREPDSSRRRHGIGTKQAFLANHAVNQRSVEVGELRRRVHLTVVGLRVKQRVVEEHAFARGGRHRHVVPLPTRRKVHGLGAFGLGERTEAAQPFSHCGPAQAAQR